MGYWSDPRWMRGTTNLSIIPVILIDKEADIWPRGGTQRYGQSQFLHQIYKSINHWCSPANIFSLHLYQLWKRFLTQSLLMTLAITVTAKRSVLQSFEGRNMSETPVCSASHNQNIGNRLDLCQKDQLVDQDPPFQLKEGRGSNLRWIQFINSLTRRKDHCSSGSTAWT